jgi:hypothetical protein
VYAVPIDGSSHLASLAGPIATDLAAVDAWWSGQDSSRTIRFDMFPFAGCPTGFGQLDISSIVLPKAGNAYSSNPPTSIGTDLRSIGFNDESKKYLIYYDGPTANASICGQGGGPFAFVWLAQCAQDLGEGGEKALTAAHELGHTFGAVDSSAPHECDSSHSHHVCDADNDLMFWAVSKLSNAVLDAGRDDYYGHSGNWLDVQDSPWLVQFGIPQVRLQAAVEHGTVTSDPAGIGECRSTCAFVYNRGTKVTLRAKADSGMRFRGWQGDCSGTEASCTVQLDAAKTARAVFAPPNKRPEASFEVKTTYEVGQPIAFASKASDSDGSIQKTEWDFGDGMRSNLVNVKHTYNRRGVYVIHLTVTDNEGATTSAVRSLVVMNIPPTVLARARSGRRGARVRLAYKVSDNVRVERARIEVLAGRDSATYNRKIHARSRSGFVWWRAPERPGTFVWCVRAWDSRGTASLRNCALVKVR